MQRPRLLSTTLTTLALALPLLAFAQTDPLKSAAAEPGAVTTPSGLVYRTLKEGTGASPTAADVVKVHYRGTLADGTEFDSSIKRGQPAGSRSAASSSAGPKACSA